MVSSGITNLDEIIKEGFLYKQSKFLREWRSRWFVLTPTTLYTYKEERKYKNPTETILLRECTTIKSAEDETHKEASFRIDCTDRTFYIQANNNQDKESWIGAIGKAMVKLNMNSKKGQQDDD